jgi:hypothetical protein
MADFSQQDLQAPGGAAPPQQAVAPANTTANTINALGQGLASLFGSNGIGATIAKNQKADAQTAQSKLVAGYAKKVTGLNAAYEQGSISMADARRQQRAAYNTIIANFPEVTEDLTKFHNTLQGAEGLGDVLAKGTAVDQQLQADTKSATAAGFIQSGMSPEQQENGLNQYRQQQHAINQMDFASKQMEIVQKKLSIQASQESIAASRITRANQAFELQQKRQVKAIQGATADVATSYLTTVQNKQSDIQKRLDAGQITNEQALAENMQIKNDFNSLTMQVRGAAGGDWVDSMAKPIMDTIQAKEDYFSGKIPAEIATNRLNNAQTRSVLPLMADPRMAAIMGISKMVPALSDTLLANFGAYTVEAINKNTKPGGVKHNPYPDGDDAEEAAGNGVYLDSLKDATGKLRDKDGTVENPKETMDELSMNVNGLIKGMNTHAGVVDNPKQMNQATDYLASREFLDYQRMGGKIDAANLAGVQNIVETNYISTLVPAIQKQWEQSQVTTGFSFKTRQVGAMQMPVADQANTAGAITYRWTGSGVVFQPAKGFEKNSGVMAQTRKLNKSLAGLINKTVHLRAHMEGSDDYSKYWKESEAEIFGVKETSDGE